MHAQRCPVAKLLAASQQNNKGKPGSVPSYAEPANSIPIFTKPAKNIPSFAKSTNNIPSYAKPTNNIQSEKRGNGLKSILPSKEKARLPNKAQTSRGQEKPSFFEKLHGDAAPLLPPCPQMYGDETWSQTFTPEGAGALSKLKNPPRKPQDLPQVLNENCSIHGINSRRGSRPCIIPKSISCPTPSRLDSRQTANAERLKNWQRSSLTITSSHNRGGHGGVRIANHHKIGQPNQHQLTYHNYESPDRCPSPLSSMPLAGPTSPTSAMLLAKNGIAADLQHRRSQFRKAWSFFSIGCDDISKEKPPPQRILRQPTRYVYRRGISGLPIECTNRSMGVAF